MSIQDLSEGVKKHWPVTVAACIVIIPLVWFAMDYLYKTRLEEKDARIRTLEDSLRRAQAERQREVPIQQQNAPPETPSSPSQVKDSEALLAPVKGAIASNTKTLPREFSHL